MSAVGAAAGPDAPEPGLPAQIGGYRVVGVLGQGGMGTVYAARDDRLGRAVAIKTIRQEVATHRDVVERFLGEARAAARVEHDNIVPIWQVGEEAGTPFLVMPLLAGESLADRLARDRIPPLGVTLRVGREVAAGLAAAHAAGLIHRDIKPGNVWLEGEPHPAAGAPLRRCRLLDFGLARAAGGTDHLTLSGAVLGTPAFMSPEQAGGKPVDFRTDLFSLGVLLYRMTTGQLPFAGPSVMAVLTSLAVDVPPSAAVKNPGVPPALSHLIDRLLAKDPARRPESAGAVAEALAAIAADTTDETAAYTEPASSSARRGRGIRVALALGAVAAVMAAGFVIIKVRGPSGKETTVEVPDGSRVSIDAAGGVQVVLPPSAPQPPAPAPAPERKFVPRRLADVYNAAAAAVWLADEFDDPKTSHFAFGNWHRAYRDGRLVVDGSGAGAWGSTLDLFNDFACDVTARTTRDRHNGWGVALFAVLDPAKPHSDCRGIEVLLDSDGGVAVVPCRWSKNKDPDIAPLRTAPHPAFKKDEFNTLTVVFENANRLSVYVNGTEAREPIVLPFNMAPAQFQIATAGGKSQPARLEFERIRVWSTVVKAAAQK